MTTAASFQPKTLTEAIRFYSDEQTCIDALAALRWPDGNVYCAGCGEIGNTIFWINPAGHHLRT